MPGRTYPWLLLSTLTVDETPNEMREETRKMATRTLSELYKLEPAAQTAIQRSAGYAVFNNMKTSMWQVSTERGGGIAVNSLTKQETFMKMIPASTGLSGHLKDYRVIFVFEKNNALSHFLKSGWSGPVQAVPAVPSSNSGGAYSGATELGEGVWVYQITKKGLAPQLELQGTQYFKDDCLN